MVRSDYLLPSKMLRSDYLLPSRLLRSDCLLEGQIACSLLEVEWWARLWVSRRMSS